jgi:hypothetical protein
MENFIAVIAFSILLLLGATLLMLSHVRAWRRHREAELDEKELDFRRRQFRRRMQTSAMIGLLGITLSVGYFLTIWSNSGWFVLGFIGTMSFLICWVCLLALVDIWATNRHFSLIRNKNLLEQTKLRAELRRLEAGKNNGHRDR